MDILCGIIERIRKRPYVYLGEKNLHLLNAYLSGYVMREFDLNPNYDNSFLRNFQVYIETHYQVCSSKGWWNIIESFSDSSEDAFTNFFRRYDEFLENSTHKREN